MAQKIRVQSPSAGVAQLSNAGGGVRNLVPNVVDLGLAQTEATAKGMIFVFSESGTAGLQGKAGKFNSGR